MSNKQMKLGVFAMSPGHHVAAWRQKDAQADLGSNFKAFVQIAQQAEAAKFDMVFLDDIVAVKDTSAETGTRVARSAFFEPTTLLSGLAAVTSRIGLTATASTTYNDPYGLARRFASLDLISDGRAGWNLVTSNTEAEAQNFGTRPIPDTTNATSGLKNSSMSCWACGTVMLTPLSFMTRRQAFISTTKN
ncbi:alkanesulfonate monooxygenase SsuD/methylene tetrahydromethanopterin reductase-like flavin-dependent oxidoreductase (luciferase family) [Rhizobium azooxidifex]|uniref:Alkanesulfonate monooxygenase SsuD/methylene tetrahydromethanopterin reductase-like flavin-dependent oxidoreductase (Luciferase family) n=1 Tax=Mycoplana azooxidifex TaxID=1636188 RepID=A0A7W6D7W6_9HYPH|nr:alkanesulfonate monooxygenase SsuD/methylene tetrahydromethanopterin reductase-like flavin-dependent oxidoreductase (luciferase family) [Mycoplana azooxidifex]